MSDSTLHLPARPSLEQLRKQAKDLLRAYSSGEPEAQRRFGVIIKRLIEPASSASLSDAQFVIAREYGFESWAKMVRHVETVKSSGRIEQFEQLAQKLAAAYTTGDKMAIREINWEQGTSFHWDHEPEKMQQRLTNWYASATRSADLALDDAMAMIARSYGFGSWTKFTESIVQPPDNPLSSPLGLSSAPPFYKIDWNENSILLRGPLSAPDWDTIIGVIKDHQITGLRVGLMTDEAMDFLQQLDCVTRLDLGGSQRLTDDGLARLGGMPQLRELEVGGWKALITDRGLEVLKYLPELRKFQSCWTQGITDTGIANLTFCDQLESVDLLGTPTGDGAIRALAGKRNLRRFKSGTLVTDAGLPFLHKFPVFKTWHGGEIKYALMSPDSKPNHLLLDGPFTDAGLASLAGLDGLFGLSFFWHITALTADSLKTLADLPRLGFLGCQGNLCNDVAMRHIASIPRLRMLMGQGTVASDDGFEALSRSQTIEYIWGRECPNLHSRGFAALAKMPALRGLAVSCANVDDGGLSALPRFPALSELMPMDVSDHGFRYVGQCNQLEDLTCMYCQNTGDVATGHLTNLSKLKSYYAGGTQITDQSLEILGGLSSLERIDLSDCAGISDAGIAKLAALPRLREISVGNSPMVTRDGMSIFERGVRANYW